MSARAFAASNTFVRILLLMSLGLQRGTVKLAPYDPEWAKLFDIEKNDIKSAFGEKALGIEHIGSTAIPGMDAKPILDLMVAVEQIGDYSAFTTKLEMLGYGFRRDNRSSQEHVLYVKGPEDKRTHYLKLTTVDSSFWREHILFRDYLIRHPESAEEYSKLKHELLEKYGGERTNYTEDKADFIKSIIRLAEQES